MVYPGSGPATRHGRAPAHSPPRGATAHGGPAVHAAATDSRPSPGVGWCGRSGPNCLSGRLYRLRGRSRPRPRRRVPSVNQPLPRQVPMSYGVSAPPGTVTVRAQLPPSLTPRVRDVSPALRFRVSASCNLPIGPDGWPRSGVLTWAVSQPFPAVTPLVGPHSRDEAADLTATTGQAGTCWTSAKRLDSEDSSSEPRHQTIGRRFPECWGGGSLGRGCRPAGIGPTCPP
jgi:hypothetical protein